MQIQVRNNVKVVSWGIILFFSIPPMILAAIESRPKTAAILLIMGLIIVGLLGPYFVWTIFLTKVDIHGDTVTVITPISKRSFQLPDDIEKVEDDRRYGGQESLDVYFRNGKDRFIFTVNKYVMDTTDNRLAELLNDVRAQVQKAKASEAAASSKPGQD